LLRGRAARALERLGEQFAALLARTSTADFEDFERDIHALFVEAEREVLAEELERLDVTLPYVLIEGRRYRRVLESSQRYTTAVGPVTVRRTLYRHGSERTVVPVELRAGIIEGHWWPAWSISTH